MAAKVTKKDRQKHSATKDGRFPVKNKSQAKSALRLRGHAKSSKKRRMILNRVKKFLPGQAKKAREADKKRGKI